MTDKETRAYMRQAALIAALLTDKPIQPETARWTVGDLVWLGVTISNLIAHIPEGYRKEDAFGVPLGEIIK